MTHEARSLLLSAVGCAALILAACGEDSDATPGPAPTDTGSSVQDTGGSDTPSEGDATDPGTCDPRWEDATYRVTNVTIGKPGGIGRLLQGLMNADFEADKLHILVQVRNFDNPGGESTMEMTGNAGATTDTPGVYTWFPGVDVVYVPARLGADGDFENLESISLTFPALLPGTEDDYLEIPVSDLRIAGELVIEGECEPIAYATLTGAILEADIEGIEVSLTPSAAPRPLADLLDRDNMDYPAGDGEKTGWQLEAQIDGVVRVDFIETNE